MKLSELLKLVRFEKFSIYDKHNRKIFLLTGEVPKEYYDVRIRRVFAGLNEIPAARMFLDNRYPEIKIVLDIEERLHY